MEDLDLIEFEIDCETFLNMYDGMVYDKARKQALEDMREKSDNHWSKNGSNI